MLVNADTQGGMPRPSDYDAGTAFRRLDRHRGPEPLVVAQLGQSLDGRIATPTGASKYINGRDALCHLHRLRASVEAVVIGVGTAVADDPRLTTRHVPGPNPARVVIDPHGRMPGDLGMLRDGAGPVIVITCPGVAVPGDATRLELSCAGDGHIGPRAIVQVLARRGLRRILIEGGADTLARFLDAEAIDELHLMVAPILLGSGKAGISLAPIETLDQAMRPAVRTMRFRDGDMLCMCEMQPAEAA